MHIRLVVFALSFLALLCVAIFAESRCLPGRIQAKYTGKLSSAQMRHVELYISADAARSGSFSHAQVPEKLRFKLGEPVNVGVVMMNTGVEPLAVCAFSCSYCQNRPELLRDGKPLTYSECVSGLLRESDSGDCEFPRVPDFVELKPNVPFRVPSVELQEWYGPLKAGHYELIIKRTFACCFDKMLKTSNKVSFDVTS